MGRWHELFEYRGGKLFWKTGKRFGQEAGWLNRWGYREVCVEGRYYGVHRIVWEMHHGPIPDGMKVDHKSKEKRDNRIENLRLATRQENNRNVGVRRDNRLGMKGIGWHKASQRYRARITVDGKTRELGFFRTVEEARKAYARAARELHGEFACTRFLAGIDTLVTQRRRCPPATPGLDEKKTGLTRS